MVKSADRLVVEARLKDSGMRWERANVNPLLTLRNGVCNERRQDTWHTACHQRQQALHEHQQEHAKQEALPQDQMVSVPPPRAPFLPLILLLPWQAPPDHLGIIPGNVSSLALQRSLQHLESHP